LLLRVEGELDQSWVPLPCQLLERPGTWITDVLDKACFFLSAKKHLYR